MKTFEDAWKEMKAKGYRYGDDALENVKVGWNMFAERYSEKLEEGEKLKTEIEYFLDNCPEAVRVREGGGMEDIAASFAVTMAKLREPKKFTKTIKVDMDAFDKAYVEELNEALGFDINTELAGAGVELSMKYQYPMHTWDYITPKPPIPTPTTNKSETDND